MAGRLHESINSFGVLLSLAVSFFGFYYEHMRTSEAVDASLSAALLKTNDISKNLESISVDLLLVNKGDSSVTVSDLWFEFDYGGPTCCIRKPAIKAQDDTPVALLIVPPMQAPKVTLRFTFQHLPVTARTN